ncbi:MAG TPA: alpha/beta fold hydrolase [Streptosporangiaceae bacterium]|nr:alpha/beta fold hydrolase [Streptosporangiaceae bacterium]
MLAEVLARVTGAGARALAVDMAGHGLRARRPAALTRRPFDAGLLATEPSPVAGVDLDQAGELLLSQIEQLGAGDPVVVVAHSAGGVVLTRAAQLAPHLVAHAVYLTAFMPASGVPALAYTRMPENEGGLVPSCVVADPAAVGALRLDVASPDPAYRERLREAFYGDLDPAVVDAAIALLTPDVPAGIGLGTTTLTAGGWGSVPRTYVVCTQDMTIRPALQRRFITDADAVFPANSTTVHTLHAAHSPFLSMPGELADIVAKVGR